MKRTSLLLMLFVLFLIPSVSQGAFKFVAWADNRPYDAANEARFRWMLEQMNQIVGSGPAFHVVPGDYDYTGITTSVIDEASLIKSYYLVPGNHDIEDLDLSTWATDLPIGNPQAKFIFLNEYLCPSGECSCSLGRVCPHTLTWLETVLQDNPAGFPVFVVGHEPAYPQNRHIGDSLDEYAGDRDAFWTVLANPDYNVSAYICGHTHYYSVYSSNGVPQIDVGNAGNPGDAFQTFVLFTVDDDGNVSYEAHTTEYNVSVYPPATNPMPADQASGISTTPVLTWTGGEGAMHRVYLGTAAAGLPESPVLTTQEASCTVKSPLVYGNLSYDTEYVWRVDEEYDPEHVIQGPVWTFRTKEKIAVRKAISETTIDGSVFGDIDGTEYRENTYEELTEALNVPNKNGYSVLEHVWRFADVPVGSNLQFRIEAHRTASADGDDFVLSYSTNGSTYTFLGSISRTADDGFEDIYTLGSGLTGPFWVKVEDTDHTKKNQFLDTVYVDCMYFVSSDEVIPFVVVGSGTSGNQPPIANAGIDQTVTDVDLSGRETVTVDGSVSSDPEGLPLAYAWAVDGTVVNGKSGSSLSYDFAVGSHTVMLTVTDEGGLSASDEATVTVVDPSANKPPVANAGPDQIATDDDGGGFETVTLHGAGSDTDGTIVSYAWAVDGVDVPEGTASSLTHDFSVGTHTVKLTVTDDDDAFHSDEATVTVNPAGGTMSVAELVKAVSLRGASGQWEALVTVSVVDQAGSPVLGATVSGTWSGDIGMAVSGTTGTDGKVTFSTGGMKTGSSVTFTVNDVTHSSLTYENGGTSSSVTIVKP